MVIQEAHAIAEIHRTFKKKSAKFELNQQDILVSDYLLDERLFFRWSLQ